MRSPTPYIVCSLQSMNYDRQKIVSRELALQKLFQTSSVSSSWSMNNV